MPLQSMDDRRTHWDRIYQTKSPDSVSWFQPSLRLSLELIRGTLLSKDAALIDVGGGASTLADDLLSLEYSNITVLDISMEALNHSKARLGPRANSINWLIGDITAVDPTNLRFDLWHDRAVFHFLITDPERRKYCDVMQEVVRAGGFAIIATFGPNGPLKCSGLEIMRYSPDRLQQVLGSAFNLVSSQVEHHTTPSGVAQEFIYCLFHRVKK